LKVSLDLNDREVEEVMEKYDDLVEKVDKMMALLERISDHIDREIA
jgi:tetrahydromethanopterin S-methyltransferase subunit G